MTSAHTAYEIAPDSDEEEDLIATTSASLLPPSSSQNNNQNNNQQNKGKGRATSPAAVGGSIDPLAGRIGSGNGGVGERNTRQTIGGITTETRLVFISDYFTRKLIISIAG